MLFRTFEAFYEEFEKISASRDRLSVPKSRSGRRSMSVSTLLRKEKEGTLYKPTPHANGRLQPRDEGEKTSAIIRASCGDEMEYKLRKAGLWKESPKGKLAAAVTEQANAVYQEFDPKNTTVTPPIIKRRGDTPTRDDIPGKAIVENRGDMAGFTAAQGFAPEGYKGY